jgi:hypothetical protein
MCETNHFQFLISVFWSMQKYFNNMYLFPISGFVFHLVLSEPKSAVFFLIIKFSVVQLKIQA